MTDKSPQDEEWKDDVLCRRQYSKFIQQYIENRVAQSNKPLTLALDSSWGTGKTFFVNKWAEDLRITHGVITFDAWKNDYAADPLISFMAAIRTGMADLQKKLPLEDAIQRLS